MTDGELAKVREMCASTMRLASGSRSLAILARIENGRAWHGSVAPIVKLGGLGILRGSRHPSLGGQSEVSWEPRTCL
eukprot:4286689-Pyramimonas_sp.AAC.1